MFFDSQCIKANNYRVVSDMMPRISYFLGVMSPITVCKLEFINIDICCFNTSSESAAGLLQ